ncbi:hypothetical protein [Ferrimicrobium sp.]|jgi:hypothetical protein|uniref:hypothetical protein n=1 Tax=Ferrimicrobium sp. TaxID=2926050 RepID=UPI002633A098|nr:hypothetical protein [Ferrimicrobium sp.]
MGYLVALIGMFIAMGEAVANVDKESGKQKLFQGLTDWMIPIAWTSPEGSHMLNVKVAGDKPAVTPGMQVEPDGLAITEYTTANGKHGISFRAKSIRPATATRVTRGTAGGEA